MQACMRNPPLNMYAAGCLSLAPHALRAAVAAAPAFPDLRGVGRTLHCPALLLPYARLDLQRQLAFPEDLLRDKCP